GPARLTVVADAAAPPGTLRRAVTEEDRSRLASAHVRLAAGLLHRLERAERSRALEKSCLHVRPRDPPVPVRVGLEAGLQRAQQLVAFRCLHRIRFVVLLRSDHDSRSRWRSSHRAGADDTSIMPRAVPAPQTRRARVCAARALPARA